MGITKMGSGFKGKGGKETIAAFILLMLSIAIPAIAQDKAPMVRKPVFAGLFYPGDKEGLSKEIDGLLAYAATKSGTGGNTVLGIIAPHAGYQYSGRVAACGYNRLKGSAFKTVIIMGSSHRVGFRGVALDSSDQWETPLGRVPVNRNLADSLAARLKFLKVYPLAFQREHSLEVQVPFLQKTLGSFSILPMVMGFMEDKDYEELSDALVSVLKKNPGATLIVASSDMSHFHGYDKAAGMDRGALKDIEALSIVKLKADLKNGVSELCGAQAVLTLMSVAHKLKGRSHVLQYANSGDVTQDTSRVVGYGSVVFTLENTGDSLAAQERKTLLAIARKSLEASVLKNHIPEPKVEKKRLREKRGAFVTLTKRGNLRGCIGIIQPDEPLYKAVSRMAIAASSSDPRFPPVSKEELRDIHIEISVLTPLKPVFDVKEIEVGKHGLYIIWRGRAGLLLPQVAATYGWGRDEFLNQTCIKAGIPPQTWKAPDAYIYSFSAQVFEE